MSASLLAMPILIVNMGGEMLYILEQRLKAQKIAADKSIKVLQDVVNTMFGQKFITALFKPQKIYSQQSTRQIFDRLAHSSIMRLNASSMGKLYDLMTMGVKYQVMASKHPKDMLSACLNHLDILRTMVGNTSAIADIDRVASLLASTYGSYTYGQWALLRRTLLGFFQDKRVKVSLFLQDGIQSRDGLMITGHDGALPVGTETPGGVRYFKSGRPGELQSVKVKNSKGVTAAQPVSDSEMLVMSSRPCKLGYNMYKTEKKKAKKAPKPAEVPEAPAQPEPEPEPPIPSKPEEQRREEYQSSESEKQRATQELNMLAALIGGGGSTAKTNINLFPESVSITDGDGKVAGSEVIVFDNSERKQVQSLWGGGVGDLDDLGADEPEDESGGLGGGLLGLMDGLGGLGDDMDFGF